MHWGMEFIIPAFLAFLVVSAFMQLFFSYAAGLIARKDGQSDLMQVLAWIPILQIAPMIVAGGGSVLTFVLGTVGLFVGMIVLGITTSFIGGSVGTTIAVLSVLFLFAVVFVYLGRILWATAAARDLPGWIGLLCFVPLVGFFVYPYIAAHDGWAPPHWVGFAIGLVLAFASTAPSFQMVHKLNSNGDLQAQIEALVAASGDLSSLRALEGLGGEPGDASTGSSSQTAGAALQNDSTSIAALLELNERFELLDRTIQAADHDNRSEQNHIRDLVTSINAELAAQREAIDPDTYHALATQLLEVESTFQPTTSGNPPKQTFTIRPSRYERREDASDTTPAALAFSERSSPAPIRPFPVNAKGGCPSGTELRSRLREHGEEEWCQRSGELGGLRHGWFARYHENGQPESMGEYHEGLRIGVWTRFFESGAVRAQAEFQAGLQQGWMLSFNEAGERLQAVRFQEGVAQK